MKVFRITLFADRELSRYRGSMIKKADSLEKVQKYLSRYYSKYFYVIEVWQ